MVTLAAVVLGAAAVPAGKPQADVILVGATGNLAGKYLWRAMLNLHLVNMHETDINFYGAGRDSAEKGEPKVADFLANKIGCGDRPDLCTDATLAEFKARVQYVQLKKTEHYASFCKELDAKDAATGTINKGRLFYLSIPPFAYADIAKDLKQHCTPADGWLRVAFEKPFGNDLKSAIEMADSLGEHLKEDQIYRFDHYLGKIGVQQISAFRQANPKLEKVLTSEHVASIVVEMTETEDCAGRAGFYDKYGVIRDIHQNHLMEVLVLAMMDLENAGTPATALKAKANLISRISKVSSKDTMVGQYDGYQGHVQTDLEKPDFFSKTPTFAYAHLKFNGAADRWAGTKVVMVAAKMLSQRQAELTVNFKNGDKITFHIQGGTPKVGPTTYIKALPDGPLSELGPLNVPDEKNWEKVTSDRRLGPEPHRVAPEFDYAWHVGPGPDLPYNRLVAAMFQGEQSEFVGTEGLLESWRVWDSVLADTADQKPYIYKGGSDYNDLLDPMAHAHDWHSFGASGGHDEY